MTQRNVEESLLAPFNKCGHNIFPGMSGMHGAATQIKTLTAFLAKLPCHQMPVAGWRIGSLLCEEQVSCHAMHDRQEPLPLPDHLLSLGATMGRWHKGCTHCNPCWSSGTMAVSCPSSSHPSDTGVTNTSFRLHLRVRNIDLSTSARCAATDKVCMC